MSKTNEMSDIIGEVNKKFKLLSSSMNALEIDELEISLDMTFIKIERAAEDDINMHPENIQKYNKFMDTIDRYKHTYQGVAAVKIDYLHGKISYEDMLNKICIITKQNQKKEATV